MPNMGGENSVSKTDVWLTPPNILQALGDFDLDPCASLNRPWNTAKKHYTIEDNGLIQAWEGRVWLNPPYGPPMGAWLEKLANHPGGGVALIFARTETKVFFDQVWDKATGIFFIRGRLSFYRPDGSKGDSAGSPSVLISYGHREAQILKSVNLSGKFIDLRRTSGEFE